MNFIASFLGYSRFYSLLPRKYLNIDTR